MTRHEAENGPSNAGSRAGPNSEPDLDTFARRNAQLLPPQPAVLETDRHQYPDPPQRIGSHRVSHAAGIMREHQLKQPE